MPRGRKRLIPIEEEIMSVSRNIESLEKKLTSQKTLLKNLVNKKKENDIMELMNVIDKNGMSIQDVINSLNSDNADDIEDDDEEENEEYDDFNSKSE